MAARKPTAKDLEYFEGLLRHVLQILNGDIRNLEDEALGAGAQNRSKSIEDGSDAYDQEFSLELLERDEGTVVEVMDALERLKAATFGRCEHCEKWIRKERLKAMPYARNCIDCQREHENGPRSG
jgi:RNA polymerase-binding transcription factor DksA